MALQFEKKKQAVLGTEEENKYTPGTLKSPYCAEYKKI